MRMPKERFGAGRTLQFGAPTYRVVKERRAPPGAVRASGSFPLVSSINRQIPS
jgi:hypothetical protein